MGSLLLSPAEVAQLTGRRYGAHQIKWLASRDWQFEVGDDRLPKVARAYAEKKLGVAPSTSRRPQLRLHESPTQAP